MTNEQIAALANVYAANARVAGMQAANQQRQVQGDSVMYSEDHFLSEAQHLEYLAQHILNQG